MRNVLRRDEPEEVYRELVDALADSAVPMAILVTLVVMIAGHVLSEVRSDAVLAAAVLCTLASAVKTILIVRHRRVLRTGCRSTLAEVRRREAVHCVSTLAVGGSVGFLTAAIFSLAQVSLHLTATSLLFGYSAGVINRLAIRPRIAIGALCCAGLPGILAAGAGGTKGHVVLAIVFAGFMGGAIQSVTYAYDTARRGVALRLQMATLARRDPLTGLYNRLGLQEAFDALTSDAGHLMAVHAFDLDGFKAVNDRLGHATGDRLLAALAERIRTMIPEGTIVARTGGDEFILVQFGAWHEAEARGLAERIHDRLTHPYDLGGETVAVGLSLGYALGPMARARLDDLARCADAASYAVKRAGGGVRAHGDRAAPPLVPALIRERSAARV